MKRILAILISCVFMFGFTFSPSMFTHVISTSPGTISGDTATGITDINSLGELVLAGQDLTNNSTEGVNEGRKSLRLMKDIALTGDIKLSSSVAIDLNGKALNLNDYILTVQHNYLGNFLIVNGTVTRGTNSTGLIALRTPNADYAIEGVAGSNFINTEMTLSVMAQKYVEDYCLHNGFNGNYWGDIDLPVTFGTSGTFTYSTAASSILDNRGHALIESSSTLTATSVPITVVFTPADGTSSHTFVVTPTMIGKANSMEWSALYIEQMQAKLGTTTLSATITNSYYFPLQGYWGNATYTCEVGGKGYVTNTGSTAYLDVVAMLAETTPITSCTLNVTVNGVVTSFILTLSKATAGQDLPSQIIGTFFGVPSAKSLTFIKDGENPVAPGYYELDRAKLTGEVQEKLTMLGLQNVQFSGLLNNMYGTFTTEGNQLKIAKDTDVSESVSINMTMSIKYPDGTTKEVVRQIALIYKHMFTDTVANPTRFESHFAYFAQALRDATHGQGDADGSFQLPAVRDNSIPYVAYRLTGINGLAYTKSASDGGIDVVFHGSDDTLSGNQAEYKPIYGADGVITHLEDLNGTHTRYTMAEMKPHFEVVGGMTDYINVPYWEFKINEEKRNARTGAIDEQLLLEYQYSFSASTTDDSGQTVWFTYADGASNVTSPLTLVATAMVGDDSSKYSFNNAQLYNSVRDSISSGYTYLPVKKLKASRNELNVKAMLYPDTIINDNIENGDVISGAEQNSVPSTITNYQWLEYLTGTKKLNLHGMRMTDQLIADYVTKCTWLTALDVSGVYDATHDYNENNTIVTTAKYNSKTSVVTEVGLKSIALSLRKLIELNVAFCQIKEFLDINLLSSTIKACHVQGNQTWAPAGFNMFSVGSMGGFTTLPLSVLASTNCKVYRFINKPADLEREIPVSEQIEKIVQTVNSIPYQMIVSSQADIDAIAESMVIYCESLYFISLISIQKWSEAGYVPGFDCDANSNKILASHTVGTETIEIAFQTTSAAASHGTPFSLYTRVLTFIIQP